MISRAQRESKTDTKYHNNFDASYYWLGNIIIAETVDQLITIKRFTAQIIRVLTSEIKT